MSHSVVPPKVPFPTLSGSPSPGLSNLPEGSEATGTVAGPLAAQTPSCWFRAGPVTTTEVTYPGPCG